MSPSTFVSFKTVKVSPFTACPSTAEVVLVLARKFTTLPVTEIVLPTILLPDVLAVFEPAVVLLFSVLVPAWLSAAFSVYQDAIHIASPPDVRIT